MEVAMAIQPKKITSGNFQKFGMVVKSPDVHPTAQAAEYKFWSDLSHYRVEGETEIGICTVYRQPKAYVCNIERHARTPEILIPIDAPFVLPVLEEGMESLEAFEVGIGEVAVIAKGIWHGACLPVGKDQSSYFVIFRRGTPHDDVEKKTITPVEIAF
jgi:ureidoglycolate hydrolase